MLVLSRRENESIKLGDSIVITVVRVAGDKVRLGIEAPANMLVLRQELEPNSVPRPAGLNGANAVNAAASSTTPPGAHFGKALASGGSADLKTAPAPQAS